MDNAKPWANRRLARPGLVRRLEVALGGLWGGVGVALVEPWLSLGVALVGLCTPESMPSIWPCGGLVVALKWLWVVLPGISALCHRFQGAFGRSLLRPAGRPCPPRTPGGALSRRPRCSGTGKAGWAAEGGREIKKAGCNG